MPEPISASHRTLVHRWVEGEKMPEAPVSEEYAFEIGEILARIHALDVDWTQMSIEDPTPRDWPELAERAVATGQPWANELASNVETFLAIAYFVGTCERPGPVQLRGSATVIVGGPNGKVALRSWPWWPADSSVCAVGARVASVA